MSVFELVIAAYLCVGFIKFVLNISQLPLFFQLIACVDCKLVEERGPVPGFRLRLMLGVTIGIAFISWLAWPQILRIEGLWAFLQPISKQRVAEIVGQPFGLVFELDEH